MRVTIEPDVLRKLYHEDKKTDAEIASIYNTSYTTISRLRKSLGIQTIKKWERHNLHISDLQLQIIYGSLLGDASIPSHPKGEGRISFMHCKAQADYILWKHSHLKGICNQPPKPTRNEAWWFQTFEHPFFSSLRSKIYPNGNKSISRSILEDITHPIALAVWYMDDGSLVRNRPTLATCCFTESEQHLLSFWLKETFGIGSSPRLQGRYWYLSVNSEFRSKFVDIIDSHVIDSMKYKLGVDFK
jgi:recombination protein RecA